MNAEAVFHLLEWYHMSFHCFCGTSAAIISQYFLYKNIGKGKNLGVSVKIYIIFLLQYSHTFSSFLRHLLSFLFSLALSYSPLVFFVLLSGEKRESSHLLFPVSNWLHTKNTLWAVCTKSWSHTGTCPPWISTTAVVHSAAKQWDGISKSLTLACCMTWLLFCLMTRMSHHHYHRELDKCVK